VNRGGRVGWQQLLKEAQALVNIAKARKPLIFMFA
jgi:hypothetical protein